jgi:catechol 2,3-dioxygenase-like lactoylglutathione lyase family enzyme
LIVSAVRLQPRLIPSLLVRDMAVTLAFYRRLGFEPVGFMPDAENPEWAEVQRDGVTLQFYLEPPPGTPREPVFSGTLYFFSDDVRALAAAWREHVQFAWGPEEMPYGWLEFGLQDPNGYYLAFAQPLEEGA